MVQRSGGAVYSLGVFVARAGPHSWRHGCWGACVYAACVGRGGDGPMMQHGVVVRGIAVAIA